MATVTLRGARSVYHDGTKFLKDKPAKVTDKVANDIEDQLPDMFDIRFGGDTVEEAAPVKKNGVTIRKTAKQLKAAKDAAAISGEVDSDMLPVGAPGRVVAV